MKKGFTLVELLGTIVVLGIMLTIAIPSIVETMRRANINEAEAYLVRLFNASETYIELNKQSFHQLKSTGGRVDIPIKYLIDEGLIRELGKDPTTGSDITENWTVVAITQADKTIKYSLYNQNTNVKSYVQDGLILHLDAINNFGIGHSNTTTVWNDLSNQNNDVININPSKWTNSSLSFLNAADALKTKNKIDASFLGKNVTVEIVLKSNQYRYVELAFPTGINLKLRLSGQNPYWNAMPVTIQSYPAQYALNTRNHYTYRNNFTQSTADMWFNGTKTSATVSNLASVDSEFNLGNSEYLIGEIYAVRVYNRALTDVEVQNNYILDQNRYR